MSPPVTNPPTYPPGESSELPRMAGGKCGPPLQWHTGWVSLVGVDRWVNVRPPIQSPVLQDPPRSSARPSICHPGQRGTPTHGGGSSLAEGVDGRGETTVQAEDLRGSNGMAAARNMKGNHGAKGSGTFAARRRYGWGTAVQRCGSCLQFWSGRQQHKISWNRYFLSLAPWIQQLTSFSTTAVSGR